MDGKVARLGRKDTGPKARKRKKSMNQDGTVTSARTSELEMFDFLLKGDA